VRCRKPDENQYQEAGCQAAGIATNDRAVILH
jgi:hypothetical protein